MSGELYSVHLLFSLFESLFLIEENPFKIFIMLRLTTVTPLWPSKNCTTLLFIRRKHVYICTTTGLEGQVFFIKFRLWTKLKHNNNMPSSNFLRTHCTPVLYIRWFLTSEALMWTCDTCFLLKVFSENWFEFWVLSFKMLWEIWSFNLKFH